MILIPGFEWIWNSSSQLAIKSAIGWLSLLLGEIFACISKADGGLGFRDFERPIGSEEFVLKAA